MIYPIRPCPWCKYTPKFIMYLDKPTWLPRFRCISECCTVNPESKYVPIRKTSKTCPIRLQEKIEKLIYMWNQNNPIPAREGVEFDFEKIIQEEKIHNAS